MHSVYVPWDKVHFVEQRQAAGMTARNRRMQTSMLPVVACLIIAECVLTVFEIDGYQLLKTSRSLRTTELEKLSPLAALQHTTHLPPEPTAPVVRLSAARNCTHTYGCDYFEASFP
jgi:hypothetical protein